MERFLLLRRRWLPCSPQNQHGDPDSQLPAGPRRGTGALGNVRPDLTAADNYVLSLP